MDYQIDASHSEEAGIVNEESVFDEKAGKDTTAHICEHCRTTTTPFWRRSPSGKFICNACGLYFKARQKIRPLTLQKNNPRKQKDRILVCCNCETTNTPLWRRFEDGKPICNACGLYHKLHGVHRPTKLGKNIVQKRSRSVTAKTDIFRMDPLTPKGSQEFEFSANGSSQNPSHSAHGGNLYAGYGVPQSASLSANWQKNAYEYSNFMNSIANMSNVPSNRYQSTNAISAPNYNFNSFKSIHPTNYTSNINPEDNQSASFSPSSNMESSDTNKEIVNHLQSHVNELSYSKGIAPDYEARRDQKIISRSQDFSSFTPVEMGEAKFGDSYHDYRRYSSFDCISNSLPLSAPASLDDKRFLSADESLINPAPMYQWNSDIFKWNDYVIHESAVENQILMDSHSAPPVMPYENEKEFLDFDYKLPAMKNQYVNY